MNAVLFQLRVETRARWKTWAAMAVLFGLVGGGVIAALAGARRTETAYSRFLTSSRSFDMMIANGGSTPTNLNRQFDFDEVAHLPDVSDAARLLYYFPVGRTADGRPVSGEDLTPLAAIDGKFGSTLNRSHLLHGRLPRAEHELALSFLAADRLGVGVGATLQLQLGGADAFRADAAPTPLEPFHVVGVVAIQGGFPPITGGLPPLAVVSPAYARTHPDAAELLAVRLRLGANGVAAFTRELNRLAGGEPIIVTDAADQAVVQRGLGVQANALRLLAGAVSLVGLLLLGQALFRQDTLGADDHPILRTLGLTPSQLRAAGVLRAAAMAAVAGAIAVVAAVALSPLTPVGVARNAELHPGVELNVAHLAIGAVVVAATVLALGTLSATRVARRAPSPGTAAVQARRSSRVTGAAGASGLPAPAVVGIGMALEPGRGRTAVPVRSTVAGAALGVAALVGVVTFASSLGHLFDNKRLYGWNWDVQLGDNFAPDLSGLAARLRRNPAVTDVALAAVEGVAIGRGRADAIAVADGSAIGPTVVRGRRPSGPDEILLGARTLDDLGLAVGERVPVGLGAKTVTMRIVGQGVLTDSVGGRLGEGAAMTLNGLRRVAPGRATNVVLVRLRAGTDAAAFSRPYEANDISFYLPAKPSDLSDLERLGGLPSVVAALLGFTAVGMLGHTLATSARRRRRDLAVLKVLGFTRRQVSGAMAWQASVLAGLAAVVGLPLGVIAGRWAWQVFAEQLGVPPRPVIPLLAVALVVPGAVLVGNLVAAVPAWLAARTQPASVLRTD